MAAFEELEYKMKKYIVILLIIAVIFSFFSLSFLKRQENLQEISLLVAQRDFVDASLTEDLDSAMQEKIADYNSMLTQQYRLLGNSVIESLSKITNQHISYESYGKLNPDMVELSSIFVNSYLHSNSSQLIDGNCKLQKMSSGSTWEMPKPEYDEYAEFLTLCEALSATLPPCNEAVLERIANRAVIEHSYIAALEGNERKSLEKYNEYTAEYRKNAATLAIEYICAHSGIEEYSYFSTPIFIQEHIDSMVNCALYEQAEAMIYKELLPLSSLELASSGAAFPRFFLEELAISGEYFDLIREISAFLK